MFDNYYYGNLVKVTPVLMEGTSFEGDKHMNITKTCFEKEDISSGIFYQNKDEKYTDIDSQESYYPTNVIYNGEDSILLFEKKCSLSEHLKSLSKSGKVEVYEKIRKFILGKKPHTIGDIYDLQRVSFFRKEDKPKYIKAIKVSNEKIKDYQQNQARMINKI